MRRWLCDSSWWELRYTGWAGHSRRCKGWCLHGEKTEMGMVRPSPYAREEPHQCCYPQEQCWPYILVVELSTDHHLLALCWVPLRHAVLHLSLWLDFPAFSSDLQSLGSIDTRFEPFIFVARAQSRHFIKIGQNVCVWEEAKRAWGTSEEWLLLRWLRSKWLKLMLQSNRKLLLERNPYCFSHSLLQTGIKRARDTFNYFKLRGEFNPKWYYKRSNKIATSQGKGERENGNIKSKNAQEKRIKTLRLLMIISFHNVQSLMLQSREWTLKNKFNVWAISRLKFHIAVILYIWNANWLLKTHFLSFDYHLIDR